MLNTGWKHWDKYLNHLVSKNNIKVLEIGVFKGDATLWILNNLFTDKKSQFYAIDVFQNSEQNKDEYGNINFKDIKKIFKSNIKKTEKAKQVKLIEKYSYIALSELISQPKELESFDFIFIDASHDAIDVITDGCLAWKLLKPEGILIFDDYRWQRFQQDFFRPKIAIDSFIKIFKSELYVLHIKRQAILKKRPIEKFVKPLLNLRDKTPRQQ